MSIETKSFDDDRRYLEAKLNYEKGLKEGFARGWYAALHQYQYDGFEEAWQAEADPALEELNLALRTREALK